jgi:hypothetical protein
VKRGFKESHSGAGRRRAARGYKAAVQGGEGEGTVVRMARRAGGSAALTARTVLEDRLQEEDRLEERALKQQVGRLMRDTTQLEDGRLAYEVWLEDLPLSLLSLFFLSPLPLPGVAGHPGGPLLRATRRGDQEQRGGGARAED